MEKRWKGIWEDSIPNERWIAEVVLSALSVASSWRKSFIRQQLLKRGASENEVDALVKVLYALFPELDSMQLVSEGQLMSRINDCKQRYDNSMGLFSFLAGTYMLHQFFDYLFSDTTDKEGVFKYDRPSYADCFYEHRDAEMDAGIIDEYFDNGMNDDFEDYDEDFNDESDEESDEESDDYDEDSDETDDFDEEYAGIIDEYFDNGENDDFEDFDEDYDEESDEESDDYDEEDDDLDDDEDWNEDDFDEDFGDEEDDLDEDWDDRNYDSGYSSDYSSGYDSDYDSGYDADYSSDYDSDYGSD